MTWSDELSVGIKVIDDDHKKLVDMLNQLHEGMAAGHGKEAVGKILDELVKYTQYHFAREEKFFAQTAYTAAASHKKEHDDLTKQVLDVQAKYKKGVTAISLEVMTFLKNWLIKHIQGSDKKYGPYLNAKGIH